MFFFWMPRLRQPQRREIEIKVDIRFEAHEGERSDSRNR